MDEALFEEWVRGMDKKFSSEGKKVASVIYNCPAYPQIENFKSIKLFFLPLNTTSQNQPMDQGMISSLKAQYRKNVVPKIILSVEKKKNSPKNTRNVNFSCSLGCSNNENYCELFSKV